MYHARIVGKQVSPNTGDSVGSDLAEKSNENWVGKSVRRREDAALLTGAGRFIDDLPVAVDTLHAAVVRSTVAHAWIRQIDVDEALAVPGVQRVITGDEIRAISDPFLLALKAPIDQWSLAVDKVRYVGEAVALVIAEDRYVAEDGADLVKVHYENLTPIVDPVAALQPSAPVLHDEAGGNEISSRDFIYGDPANAFAAAERTVKLTVNYPRASFTPMECFVVVAEYLPGDDSYDVLANFQGPFSVHPVIAKSLRVPSTRMRLRTPADSGGSFGIKLSVFPYIVLMALAARIVGRPVKWVEDRLEHLTAASSGPNRMTEIEAAVQPDGKITALRMDNLEDYGAFLRAPMPGPLYRMQGASTGAYDIRHLELRNRIVVTNKAPAALIRGFGGPQLYLALERLMQRIAVELELDPLDVIRRNLIANDAFPYKTAAGALYDSGDYQRAIDIAVGDGRLADLHRRRNDARQAGKFYGVGMAAVVEPGMSNMGYLSTLVPLATREKQGPKNGAVSMATVNVDPLGNISVTADATVQGQGHATVLSQIVADRLGCTPDKVAVNLEIDTQKDAWSIAAGTYSCRFTPGTAVAAHIAADRIRAKVTRMAATQFNTLPDDIEFEDGHVFSKRNRDNKMPFERMAGTAHWSPVMMPANDSPGLRETAVWSPPELSPPTASDEINTSLTYGFLFDLCGVEIDPVTMEVRVDRYVSMHDAGKLLNPMIAEGQIRGAFAQGIASALYEEFVYDDTGAFQSGTFADYLVPTANEIPPIELLHIETPSPFTPLGAKGIAEGNCMSTPVCIANAIADALSLKDVPLPATPKRLNDVISDMEPACPEDLLQHSSSDATVSSSASDGAKSAPTVAGRGEAFASAHPEHIWTTLLDPECLQQIIPGCRSVTQRDRHHYKADVSLGVGPIRGRFDADVHLSDLHINRSATLTGSINGLLGQSEGTGHVVLTPEAGGTRILYTYSVNVGGKVSAVGGRMIQRTAEILIGQFFQRLGRIAVDGRRSQQSTVELSGERNQAIGAGNANAGAKEHSAPVPSRRQKLIETIRRRLVHVLKWLLVRLGDGR